MAIQYFLEENSTCPRCGDEDGVILLEIEDKQFSERNALPRSLSIDISETGEFEILACVSCGLKWAVNEEVASTSQLRAALLDHYIGTMTECDNVDLEDIVSDMMSVGILSEDKYGTYEINKGPNFSVRLETLKALSEFLSTCDVSSLVDLYNTTFINLPSSNCIDVSEALETDIDEKLITSTEDGVPLCNEMVLADD